MAITTQLIGNLGGVAEETSFSYTSTSYGAKFTKSWTVPDGEIWAFGIQGVASGLQTSVTLDGTSTIIGGTSSGSHVGSVKRGPATVKASSETMTSASRTVSGRAWAVKLGAPVLLP